MEGRGVAVMGWFIILSLPVTVFFAVTGMGERKLRPQPKILMREAIEPLINNHALQRLVLADFVSGFSGSAIGAMFIYEASYILLGREHVCTPVTNAHLVCRI